MILGYMLDSDDALNVVTGFTDHGDPIAYKIAEMPWRARPLAPEGYGPVFPTAKEALATLHDSP